MSNITAKIFFIFLLISSYQVSAAGTLNPKVVTEIEKRIASGMLVGMVIGVIDEDGEQYYSFGRESLDSSNKPNENTIFDIGSISKTFATTMLADMVASGEISYHKPIRSYLPPEVDIPRRGKQEITLWHLATHSSGLPLQPVDVFPTDIWDTYGNYTLANFYDELSRTELSFDVGAKSVYSSFGLGLLGHILELNSKRSFEELLSNRITDVLSMPSTSSVLSPKINKNLAQGHSYLIPTYSYVNPVFPAGGAIKSSAKDMLRYLSANLGLVKSPLEEAMKSTQVIQFEQGVASSSQGLGWWVMESDGNKTMMHTGKTHGYHSVTGFNPEQKRGVVVLTNSNGYIDDIGMHLLMPSVSLWNSIPPLSVAVYKAIASDGSKVALAKFRGLSKQELERYYINENGLNDTALHYVRKGMHETGIELLQYRASLFPTSAHTYDSLGWAYSQARDNKAAISNYKKALELDPLLLTAQHGLKKLLGDNSPAL